MAVDPDLSLLYSAPLPYVECFFCSKNAVAAPVVCDGCGLAVYCKNECRSEHALRGHREQCLEHQSLLRGARGDGTRGPGGFQGGQVGANFLIQPADYGAFVQSLPMLEWSGGEVDPRGLPRGCPHVKHLSALGAIPKWAKLAKSCGYPLDAGPEDGGPHLELQLHHLLRALALYGEDSPQNMAGMFGWRIR
ncbi:unnamed protein product, partial [Amoebophrya sp. A120]|eukprot:GSA120T00018241001.1